MIYECKICQYVCGNRKSSYDKHCNSQSHLSRVQASIPMISPDQLRIRELENLLKDRDNEIKVLNIQLENAKEIITLLKSIPQTTVSLPSPVSKSIKETKKYFCKTHFLNEICKNAKDISKEDMEAKICDEDLIDCFIHQRKQHSSAYLYAYLIFKYLKTMPETERPIWCFDAKRNVFACRNKSKWVETANLFYFINMFTLVVLEKCMKIEKTLSLIHISEPTRQP
jgi:hypothetical protein